MEILVISLGDLGIWMGKTGNGASIGMFFFLQCIFVMA